MAKVCVTGAAGFIGGHLAETLLKQGHQVFGLDDFSSGKRETAALLAQHRAFTMIEGSITDPAAVEGLQFIADLMHKHKVSPTPDAFADQGMQGFFGTGKVGMVDDNPTAAAAYRRFDKIDWDVAPFPIGKGAKRGVGGGGTAWAMLSAAKNPDAAWKFLKHITSEKAQQQEVAVGGTTPSRLKVVQSDEFLKPAKPKNAKGFAQAQGYVVRDPVHVKWPQVQIEVVNAQMALLFSGKADAATVAKTIKEKGDAAFKS